MMYEVSELSDWLKEKMIEWLIESLISWKSELLNKCLIE